MNVAEVSKKIDLVYTRIIGEPATLYGAKEGRGMKNKWRILLILSSIFVIGFLHYSCELFGFHTRLHNVLYKFFFIPIIFSAFWWGLRGGLFVGLLCASIASIDLVRWWDPENTHLYNEVAELALFLVLGGLVGVLVDTERRHRSAKLKAEEQAQEEFRRSITDPLTHAFNRRYMEQALKETWHSSASGHSNFSLLMIDLNRFKFINDNYGHLAGDRVLQAVVQTLFGHTREGDKVFRYGGDEFIVLLPKLKVDETLSLAKRLRNEFAKLEFKTQGQGTFRAEFSIGVLEYNSRFKTIHEMIHALDGALYKAKKENEKIALAS